CLVRPRSLSTAPGPGILLRLLNGPESKQLMRKYLVAGNWKMNGGTAANNELCEQIAAGVSSSGTVELLVCPPFPYLESTRRKLEGHSISLGAQNVSEYPSGAYTGEVS